jgi:Region found in RelA / SpoT proteins
MNAPLSHDLAWLHDGDAGDSLPYGRRSLTVSDFHFLDFSNKEVARAGRTISGDLIWNRETEADIRHAFLVANNWRDSHAYPMASVRSQLTQYVRHLGIQGITAARLKRMQAIRRKLSRANTNFTLNQLRDLGGCRVIVMSISDVKTIVDALTNRSRHELKKENDYISNPKEDGYRSHHLIFSFKGKGDAESYSGRRIEIQIRTRLQHSWGTAVESIGLFRGENLKGHDGDKDWLRFFQLMSSEFAFAEKCPESKLVPSHRDRIKEIIELNRKLEAMATLDNLSHAVHGSSIAVDPRDRSKYYLISYDNRTMQVSVEPYSRPIEATQSYDLAEYLDNASGTNNTNVVLVEADKIVGLRDAYPNYFGDVQLFKRQLANILSGKDVREYKIKLQSVAPSDLSEAPDLSWFRRSRFPKPRGA